jgi:histidinol phosphatase-like enzyme (inositol monophosphatase family)
MALAEDNETSERLRLAIDMAEEAGQWTLRYFRGHDLKVERKADQSPVTVADREAEELLRRHISDRFGKDGIVGEEFGELRGTNEYQWVLDPIDGTKSFIYGIPLFTTLVAVLKNSEPLIGVIHAPARGEMVYAAKGRGCWYQSEKAAAPQPARVSQVDRLDDSLLLTTELKSFRHNGRSDALDRFMRLQQLTQVTRTWGDGYGYLMVATGRAEVMIDPIVNLWDAAPLQPIIEEAGGHFSDWNGVPTIRAEEAVATNGRVTRDVLAILSGE